MNTFYLFLPDFKAIVKNSSLNLEKNIHPVWFFEETGKIYFYKVIGSIVYVTLLEYETLPSDINVDNLIVDDLKRSTGPIFQRWYTKDTPYILVLEVGSNSYLLTGGIDSFEDVQGDRFQIKAASTNIFTPKGSAKLKLYLSG